MSTKSTILYIEDERPVFELIRQALKSSGHEVIWANGGRQGLAMMRTKPPDLVLLDLMMPDLNGWEVYKAMHNDEQLASIPVIVVSARVPHQDRILVEGLPPVADYITKPFDIARLTRSIKNNL